MPFELTPEQRQLQELAREYLTRPLWSDKAASSLIRQDDEVTCTQ